MDELIELRHELHQYPETAHKEAETAKRIKKYLSKYRPDDLVDEIGGHGLAAIYDNKNGTEGPTIMLRCELDALPIAEVNEFDYRSVHEGKGHKCGHDGHMAIIAGMAAYLHQNPPEKGRVILLFQPAEETGEGADKILDDPKFKSLQPDFIFALHNLPGFPKGHILVKDGIFASASKGIIIRLKGAPSHASHPENGRNPALAASQIVQSLFMIPQMQTEFHRASLITPVKIAVGQEAFGTSAGNGEIMATLRTHRDMEMEILAERAELQAQQIARAHDLDITIEYTEEFQAVDNDPECNRVITKAAKSLDLSLSTMDQPFPWSEDFGLFTKAFNGALFGLGSGKDQPQLHNEDYDFPDEIIETGVAMFQKIVKYFLSPSTN